MTFIVVEAKFNRQVAEIETNLDKLVYTMKTLHTTQPTQYPAFWNEEWLKRAIDELDMRKMTPEERAYFARVTAANAEAVKVEKQRIRGSCRTEGNRNCHKGIKRAANSQSRKLPNTAELALTLFLKSSVGWPKTSKASIRRQAARPEGGSQPNRTGPGRWCGVKVQRSVVQLVNCIYQPLRSLDQNRPKTHVTDEAFVQRFSDLEFHVVELYATLQLLSILSNGQNIEKSGLMNLYLWRSLAQL